MKYLKTYKLFENIKVSRDLGYQSIFSDEFISTLKDFCLDLSDKDYEVRIYECEYSKDESTMSSEYAFIGKSFRINADTSSGLYKSIAIDVYYPDNETFINVLLSIQDFCKEYNFGVDVEIPKEDLFLSVDDFIDYSDGGDFSQLSIIIYQQSK